MTPRTHPGRKMLLPVGDLSVSHGESEYFRRQSHEYYTVLLISKKQTEKGQSKSELTWKGGFSCGGRRASPVLLHKYRNQTAWGFCFFLRNLK